MNKKSSAKENAGQSPLFIESNPCTLNSHQHD